MLRAWQYRATHSTSPALARLARPPPRRGVRFTTDEASVNDLPDAWLVCGLLPGNDRCSPEPSRCRRPASAHRLRPVSRCPRSSFARVGLAEPTSSNRQRRPLFAAGTRPGRCERSVQALAFIEDEGSRGHARPDQQRVGQSRSPRHYRTSVSLSKYCAQIPPPPRQVDSARLIRPTPTGKGETRRSATKQTLSLSRSRRGTTRLLRNLNRCRTD